MDVLEVIFEVTTPAGNFYYAVTLLNYSNSFLNPVVYGLRIPEFRRAMAIFCFKRKLAANIKNAEGRCRHNSSLTSDTRLKTLRMPSHSHRRTSLEVEITQDTSL